MTREGAKATELGGDIVVEKLPHLTGFKIGREAANITRTKDAVVNVSWPWTGRMDEWLMEEVPDKPDFGDMEYDSM